MSKLATVSVLIATYNRSGLIRETLESILAQTRAPDEIIVVDDGSTDDTAIVLAEYADRIVYRHQANQGKSVALNLALESAESSYVWIFDDDDIALPDAIASHMGFLEQHPEFDFSYSPGYRFSGNFPAQKLNFHNLNRLTPVAPRDFLIYVLESMPIKVQGMMVPMRCYHCIGKFDPALYRSQDHDILIRLARCFRAGLLEEPTYALRVHDGLRGPSFARHTSADRARNWRQYQRLIYGRLRDDMTLAEYLPNQTFARAGRPTKLEIRRALIQRAYIMAQHGLYEEAISDITKGFEATSFRAQEPTQNERRLLSQMVCIDDMENIPPTVFYWALGNAAGSQTLISRNFFRGFYWSYRKSGRRLSAHVQNSTRLGGFLAGEVKAKLGSIKRPT